MIAPLEFGELRDSEEIADAYVTASLTEPEARWNERVAALEAKLVLETERARVLADAAGREAESQTREAMSLDMERQITVERAKVAKAMAEFKDERDRYFAEVEAEVVGLALAIAKRVLHREASLDPLLLQAAVRVALDKVAGESNVVLRVAEGQAEPWRDVLAAERGDDAVAVVEDKKLEPAEMVIETGVGRVELGVSAQLREIERGFFDLLEKRPVR